MRYLYSFLFYLLQPVFWLRLLYRSLKVSAYRNRWLERYGFYFNKVKKNGIVIHAVSVGETIAAIPLVRSLQENYPTLPITVTTMTPTGSERVHDLLGNSVSHVYLPYDLPGSMRRFVRNVQPKLVIIMETELWPNLIHQLHKHHIPIVIANARLSARSLRRYRKFGCFSKSILNKISCVAAQHPQDGKRFLHLGLAPSRLAVTGSLKYDIALTDLHKEKIAQLRTQWNVIRPVLIAASTHNGEEEIILTAFAELLKTFPDLLLILVPRHPQRFGDVEKLVAKKGLSYQLRSHHRVPTDEIQVVIGDTMGELNILFGLATVALIGGSLVPHGGHNPLEAALHAVPIIVGPHTFNFSTICQRLTKNNALIRISEDPQNLSLVCTTLLTNAALRAKMGYNASCVLQQNQGSLERLLAVIEILFHVKSS